MDDSKLRLRKNSHILSPLATCEEGTAAMGMSRKKSFDGGWFNNNSNINSSSSNSNNINSNNNSSSSSSNNNSNNNNSNNNNTTTPSKLGSRIRGRVKRRRRKALVGRWCRLCLGGLAAAIVSVTLSVSLLPFSWTQVDYHHQFQHEVQYVYQKLHDNRQNYHSVIDNYHAGGGMFLMHKQQQQQQQQQHQHQQHHKHNIDGGDNNTEKNEKLGPVIPKRNLRRPETYPTVPDKKGPKPPEIVQCVDGSSGFKNDDYCDCPLDGSDEPDTSACSNVLVQKNKFVCGRRGGRNSGTNHQDDDGATTKTQPKWIYASRVNDGVIDCPDGSDEYGNVMEKATAKMESKSITSGAAAKAATRDEPRRHHYDDDYHDQRHNRKVLHPRIA